MNNPIGIIPLFLAVALLTGCVPTQDAGFDDVKKWVGSRMALTIASPAEMQQAIQSITNPLLEKPLSVDNAVQIALLNNKTLQAKYEDLWIAKAEYSQAGALSNPVFSGSVLLPSQSGNSKTEFSIEQNFLDFFLMPLKGKANDAQFEKTKLEVAQSALDLAFAVKSSYYNFVAAGQTLAMRKVVFEASEASIELTRRQFQAGNISELQQATEEALHYQAQLDLAESQSNLKTATEKLRQLLGLRKEMPNWDSAETLADISGSEPTPDALEATALAQRLDLSLLKQDLESQKQRVSSAAFSEISQAKLGLKTEGEPDGGRFTGPTVEIPIPVFQSGQPALSRQEALVRQAQNQVEAKESLIMSEVKLAYEHLLASRKKALFIRNEILPLRVKLIDLTQKHYNYMLIGVFTLLQAKQNEVNARQSYIEALREYWIARSELERAVGAKLAIDKSKNGSMPAKKRLLPTAQPHHH